MSDFVNLPPVEITKDLIERVQFSLSSRNSENKVGECAVHVFASRSVENLQDIQWQYVASGVPCILRNRELHKNGRKYMWSMNLCLYNAHYGVLVWKSKLAPNCDYTTVADNFHVFALAEVNVIVGMLFTSKEQACELNTQYTTWHQERQRDDGKKGPSSAGGGSQPQQSRFRKEMISKPCNFQHIQGTQALDECLEIERIKADIIAALFGLGTSVGRSEADGQPAKRSRAQSKRNKHEITMPKVSFKMISVPRTSMSTPPTSPPHSTPSSPPISPPIPEEASTAHEDLHTAHTIQFQATVEVTNGYQAQTEVFTPPEAPIAPVAPAEPAQPTVVTTDFSEAGTGEFISEPAQHSQDSQPPPMYDQLDVDNDKDDYDRLEPLPNNSSQGSFGYSQSPPRLDLNLEKEFTESVLFQSPLMTAN